ncbi:hypothetical protein SAMN02799636_01911 [Methylobacterium sp. 275MFSha3.1]|uniref:hypothetical protein n=1 Tax=Methylobacterium sp. 275MFSha3.1 TaxID=1502746 RepID=UPI0008A771CB|nr:hypothetical protein [Methylobacterium sp. 275MFSha3.1]SEH37168.1 hypothetical protein SAMN02799636_01911 [Methylobacterium sp. 275MFSha3.1]
MAPAPPTTDRDWRGFARTLALSMVGLFAGYLALAVLVDPYDTGRSTLLSRGAVRPQGPRTASAVRGRDPAYAGVVIGNSHIQLIEPAALTRLTGIPFLQLSVPATGPSEQFALLGWYLQHHARPAAIVLSADAFWCADDPSFPSEHGFPYWLVGDWPAYLRGLIRFSAAQETVNRIGWLLNPRRKTAAADGWWDYERNYLSQGFGVDPAKKAALEKPVGPEQEPRHGGPFPIAARLRAELTRIPAETPVVVVFPPVYARGEPPPGSPRARAEAACRAEVRTVLATHALSTVVDWRDGRPAAADPDQFFDQTHYRLPIARSLKTEIAEAIVRLRTR